MNPIEEYKKEILLKIMSGEGLTWDYVETLPKEDSLRTFICELGSLYAYYYARYVDKSPRDDTRKAACRDPNEAYWYSRCVDKSPHDETQKAAYRDPFFKEEYIKIWHSYLIDKYVLMKIVETPEE